MRSVFQAMVQPSPQSTENMAVPALPREKFWREFFRVQSDKFILFALIIFLHYSHSDAQMQAAAVGGLIVLIQGQRFKTG